jgi:hypothetical protein
MIDPVGIAILSFVSGFILAVVAVASGDKPRPAPPAHTPSPAPPKAYRIIRQAGTASMTYEAPTCAEVIRLWQVASPPLPQPTTRTRSTK